LKFFSVGVCCLSLVVSSWAAARRPTPFVAAQDLGPANYLPHVEKLSDRYRLTIETPDGLPHYLVDKTDDRVWLRLMRPAAYPSQILEGDSVVKDVRLIRHRRSSDVIINFGEDAKSSDVYFDEGRQHLVVDVMIAPFVDTQATPKPAVISMPKKTVKSAVKKGLQPIVVKKTPPPEPEVPSAAPAPATAVVATPKPKPVVQRKDGAILIVVDAGHGGLDCGAIGTRGTLEKKINLDVARALSKALSKEKNVEVLMTRDSDVFIPLQERTRIANDANADLFVSVHCNSSLGAKNTGFETYYLAPSATDKAAAAVARQENSVVGLEASKGEHSTRLNEVLASMAVGNYINESSRFASLVCRHVRQETSQNKVEIKEADFFVLRGAQMPSILLELEYLSNPLTEIKLRSSRFQTQMVKAVVSGIKAYRKQKKLEQEAMASQPRSMPASQ
jgi:N-acetylmuramoyl-L-alanine amidase